MTAALFRRAILALSLFTLVFAVSAQAVEKSTSTVLLGGGGGYYTLPVKSWLDRRYRTVFRQRYDFSCGSAALATLLSYHYGRQVDERQVINEMFKKGDQDKIKKEGFSLLDMKSYLGS